MKLTGRELVDEIDKLIIARIKHFTTKQDEVEVIKRNITDSLLAMDARKGVYVDDSAKHESKPNPNPEHSFWYHQHCHYCGVQCTDLAGRGWMIGPRQNPNSTAEEIFVYCPRCVPPEGSKP